MKSISIPEKLYGREKEIESLFESFERISKGVGELLTVSGTSGAGKTALVQELQIPVKNENVYFVSGKFEQFQQNIPYFAFQQGLTSLCRIILAEDEVIRAKYKEDILNAIGSQGQVLTDLIPEFEILLGKQPPLGDISPQEARHRFSEVLRRFLSIISKPEHPLVLFIDDWQWADTASLELLKQLKVGSYLRYILVIISYRDNEVDSGHPLTVTLEELKRDITQFKTLKVNNLIQKDILDIIEDTLKPEIENKEKLAAIIHKKTLGNPFFVHAAVNYLYDFKMLWFSQSEKIWKWNIDPAHDNDFPGNVVDLFVNKFHRMNQSTQILFSLAACLGNRFSVKNLYLISDFEIEECKSILNSPEGKEIASPLKVVQNNKEHNETSGLDIYVFRHDRMQQAAFLLIDEKNHRNILVKIGKLLLTELNPEELNERIFEVVNHLNAGIEVIKNTSELEELFKLNIQAARKAYTAIAYSAALQFYRKAEKILEKDGFSEHMWNLHHDMFMNYLKERAICEFLDGDHEIAEQCVYQSVEHANNVIEKAEAYNILIVQYTLQARYPDAIASGKSALKALGILLPEKDFDKARDEEIAKVRTRIKTTDISSLSQLPKMTNPEVLTACKILITMGPPCYRSHQKLWGVMVPVVVGLTLEYGNIPQVGYSHTAFGGLLGWVDDDYATAKQFADVATTLMTKTFPIPSQQSVFYLMIGSSIRHWFKHLKYSSQDYIDAYETGLRSGNLQYAAYAFGHNMYCRFYQGVSLDLLISETKHSLDFSETRHNQWAIDLFTGGLKIMQALTVSTPLIAEKQITNDVDYLKNVDAHQNIQVKCIYKVLKTFSLLMLGNYKEALSVSDETEPVIYTVGTQGLLPWPEHVFARVLIYAQLYSEEESQLQNIWLEEIKAGIKKLRTWADYGIENFEHKYYLANAEFNQIEGNLQEALKNYHKAADAAHKNEFIQWEGYANERIYSFWLKLENYHLAFHYWKQAYICYKQWGIFAKLKQMEDDYINFLEKSIAATGLVKKGAKAGTEKFSNWLITKQMDQIRELAFHLSQSKLSTEAANQAEELASATKRLRTEVSYRKQAEDEVKRKNRDLEIINVEKDKFFSIISHDLKTPFNAILGLSELLVDKVRENDLTGIEKMAKMVQQSSHNAMELLTNLIEWSRAQTGRMRFSPTSIDLADIISENEFLFASIAEQKNITFSKNIQASVRVIADISMINTVLRNLISNAIKFTYPGGKITITANKVDKKVVIQVADTGVGIPKEIKEKLFTVEHSHTTNGTQNEKGTGLGLILCREFIAKHGGEIGVTSKTGIGSTFFFSLSADSNSKVTELTEEKPNISLTESKQKPKILIAEDDETSSQYLSLILSDIARVTLLAKNGKEAVRLFRENPDIDVILMDFKMPVMDGFQATRQIRKLDKDVIIIAQTAYALEGDYEKAIEAGCNDHISKPVNAKKLQEKIDELFLKKKS